MKRGLEAKNDDSAEWRQVSVVKWSRGPNRTVIKFRGSFGGYVNQEAIGEFPTLRRAQNAVDKASEGSRP